MGGWRLRWSESAIVVHRPPPDARWLSLGGVLGLAVSAVDGLELNVLGLNFGVSPSGVKLRMVGWVGSSSGPSKGAEKSQPKGLVSGERLEPAL